MRVALHRIFRKKVLLWICLLFLFGSLKVFSMYITEKYYPQYKYIDSWVEESSSLSEEHLSNYVSQLAQKVNSDEQYRKTVGQDFSAFLKSYENRTFIRNLISFARNGQGVLSSKIPDDFENLQVFYRDLDVPSVINEQPLTRYFFLQSINIVPIIILLLCALIWGEHYEQGIYRATSSTLRGDCYHKTVDITLISLGVCFLTVNELFDLWYSGLLKYGYIWKCSVQSYNYFRYSQLQSSIGTVLLISFTSKLIGILGLSFLGMLIAQWKKSVRESVIWAMLILIVLLFIGKAFENTKFYSIIQIGIIDWKYLISKITILEPLQLNTLVLGLLLTFFITVIFYCYLVLRRLQKKQ